MVVNFYIKSLKCFGSLIIGSLNLYKAASRLFGALWSLKCNQTSRTARMVPMLARYSKQGKNSQPEQREVFQEMFNFK